MPALSARMLGARVSAPRPPLTGVPSLPPRSVSNTRNTPTPSPSRGSSTTARAISPGLAKLAFTGAMVAVMPVYGLMMAAPKRDITKKVLATR